MKSHRPSVLLTWIISYLAIMGILLVSSVALYIGANRIINKQINDNLNLTTRLFQTSIDNRLNDIEQSAFELVFDDKVNSLLYYDGPSTPFQRYKATEVIRDLRMLSVANTSIGDIYLHIAGLDYVLTTDMKYGFDEFVKWNLGLGDPNSVRSRLYETDRAAYGTLYEDPALSDASGADTNSLFYFRRLPIADSLSPLGAIIIRINTDVIMTAMEGAKISPNSIISIVDEDKELILSTDPEPNWVDNTHESLIESTINRWTYRFRVPLGDVTAQIVRFRKITLYGVGACLLLALGISYTFALRNHGHMHQLLDKLRGKEPLDTPAGHNEYELLERSIDRIIDENRHANNLLEQQQDGFKRDFLKRLLLGNVRTSERQIVEVASSHGIALQDRRYLVMIVYFSGMYGRLVSQYQPGIDGDLAFDIVSRIILDDESTQYACHLTQIEDSIAVLATCSDDPASAFEPHVDRLAERICAILEDKTNIRPATASSAVHTRVFDVSQAYHEAVEVIEYSALQSSRVRRYGEIPAETKNIYGYSLEDKVRLINCLSAEDYSAAKQVFDNAVEHLLSRHSGKPWMLKIKLLGLLNLITDCIEEIDFFSDDALFDSSDPIQRLIGCSNILEVREIVDEYFEVIIASCNRASGESGCEIQTAVQAILSAEFENPELSVSYLAEELGLNPSYLSRAYKDQTGSGLLDHIHRYRIEKAKELLRANPGQPVKEIALSVGWTNPITFIRVFKKQEGLTPGVYRQTSA